MKSKLIGVAFYLFLALLYFLTSIEGKQAAATISESQTLGVASGGPCYTSVMLELELEGKTYVVSHVGAPVFYRKGQTVTVTYYHDFFNQVQVASID